MNIEGMPDQNLWIGTGTVEEAEYKGTDNRGRPFVVRMKTTEHGANDRTYTEYHNVVGWGKRGDEMNESIQNGDRIYVTGRVQTKKKDDRYYTSIYCHSFANLTAKGGAASPPAKETPQDDIPF